MSDRPVMSTRLFGRQCSVYLHEDRVEIGAMDMVYTETLSRVAFRDARRLVVWHVGRRVYFWIGVVVLVIGAVLAALAVAALFEGPTDVGPFFSVLAAGTLIVGGLIAYAGRPGGITKFRLEGARGHVEGVLSGSRRKREALIAEIESRIHTRQTSRQA